MSVPPSTESSAAGGRFPRAARLLNHADFERVYDEGKRHFSANLTAFYLPRSGGGGGLRVGFTVSRALGGAVERNRIRRRMREAVRLQLPKEAPAMDIVINPKKSALQADFTDLLQEVAKMFVVAQKQVLRSTQDDNSERRGGSR